MSSQALFIITENQSTHWSAFSNLLLPDREVFHLLDGPNAIKVRDIFYTFSLCFCFFSIIILGNVLDNTLQNDVNDVYLIVYSFKLCS